MLSMKFEKKYYANIDKLNLVCRELNIVKSKWDSAMEKMPIKGLAVKNFSLMSTGQKKFSIEIYQEMARNFTKLYKKKGIQKEISYEDLFVDKEKNTLTNNEKEKMVYLEKYEEYGDVIGDVNPKLIYNRVRVNSNIVSVIEYFVKSMDSTNERQEKYKNVFYSSDEQLDQIKDEAEINSWLDSLKNHGVKVFAGLIEYPIISYQYEYISHDDGLYEIYSQPAINGYFILLFSPIKDDIDYYKFHYNIDYDYETLKNLQKKFPVNFEFPVQDIEKFNFKNEANNRILNTMANKYLELASDNKEFEKIIPSVSNLPFSFNGMVKIVPIKRNKKVIQKDNEKN